MQLESGGASKISNSGLIATVPHTAPTRWQLEASRVGPILLVAFLTLAAFMTAGIGLARITFKQTTKATEKCLVSNDFRTGVRGVPSSFCREKTYETAPVDYRFNDCGFRTPQPCAPAASGVYRIVIIGSSFNYGMRVAQPDTFAAQLAPMLSGQTKHRVDIFNEAMIAGFPQAWALRPDWPLRPHPSLILWPLTPMDIRNPFLLPDFPPKPRIKAAPPPSAAFTIHGWSWARFMVRLADSQMVFALQHYLYRSQSQYLTHTLAQGHEADYLRVPAPPALQDDLSVFARNFRAVAARARAAGVPLVVTLLPTREQAIMLSNRAWDKGYDPNQLGRLVRPIVEAEGARFVDMTPGIASLPDAGNGYLPVDGHPDAEGQRMFATLLGHALVRSGALTAARTGMR